MESPELAGRCQGAIAVKSDRILKIASLCLLGAVFIGSIFAIFRSSGTGVPLRPANAPERAQPDAGQQVAPNAFSSLGRLIDKASPGVNVLDRLVEKKIGSAELQMWTTVWITRAGRGEATDDAFRDQLEVALESSALSAESLIELGKCVRFIEPPGPAATVFRAAIRQAALELRADATTPEHRLRLVASLAEIRYPLWQMQDLAAILAAATLEMEWRVQDYSPEYFDACLWFTDSSRALGRMKDAERVAAALSNDFDSGKYPRVKISKRRELDHLRGLALAASSPRDALPFFELASSHPEEGFSKQAATDWLIHAAKGGATARQIQDFAKRARSLHVFSAEELGDLNYREASALEALEETK